MITLYLIAEQIGKIVNWSVSPDWFLLCLSFCEIGLDGNLYP